MGEDKPREWIDSDKWKEDTNTNWQKIDYYVDKGYMSPEDRDLCHAYESLVHSDKSAGSYTDGNYQGDYKAANDAWSKFGQVDDEHRGDKFFDKKNPAIDPPKYDKSDGPKGTYHPPPVDIPAAPKVPGDEGNGKFKGKDRIAVNTDALTKFADNIDQLRVDLVKPAAGKTESLDVKPGGFSIAYALRHKITTGDGNSDKGLKTDLSQYVNELSIQLTNICDEVRKLVADYNNTEDLNKLSAEKLNVIMNDSFSYIDKGSQKPTP